MSAASGGEGISNPSVVNKPIPDQLSSKLAWASNGASGGNINCRSFDQIIEEESPEERHLTLLTDIENNIQSAQIQDFITKRKQKEVRNR